MSQRYSPETLEKRREYSRVWYQNNKDYFKKYAQENKNRILELREIHRERNKEYQKQYKNSEKYKTKYNSEYFRIWKTKNEEHLKNYRARHDVKLKRKINKRLWDIKNREYRKEYNEKHIDRILSTRQKLYNKLAKPFNKTIIQYRTSLMVWSKTIRSRDQKCVVCGDKNSLIAHHLIYKSDYPELSLNKNNGVTLCISCHDEVHGRNLINFS